MSIGRRKTAGNLLKRSPVPNLIVAFVEMALDLRDGGVCRDVATTFVSLISQRAPTMLTASSWTQWLQKLPTRISRKRSSRSTQRHWLHQVPADHSVEKLEE